MTTKLIILAVAIGAATAVFSAGAAHADQDVSGMTWSEASSSLQSSGITARVSAQVGDRLPQGDCIVTGQTKSAKPPNGFHGSGTAIVLVALDCNGKVATGTRPGYSAGSPEGRKAKQREWLASEDGHAWCAQTLVDHPDWGHVPGCTYD
jgi:hypothetical protein